MENIKDRISIDPDVMGGKPVIKGTRIPVYLIVEFAESGMTEVEILKEYPQLRKKDIKAALLYASKRVERCKLEPQLRPEFITEIEKTRINGLKNLTEKAAIEDAVNRAKRRHQL